MTLVVDASAVPACLAAAGCSVLPDVDLVAPALLWSEARSALHELVWRGELSHADGEAAREILDRCPVRRVEHERLGEEAWRVAEELGWAKTYDAEYVALGRLLECRVVTLDARLLRGAARLGVVVSVSELRRSVRAYDRAVVPEAPIESTEAGLVVAGEGWFVLNARDARWRDREGRGKSLPFEGKSDFPQVGINLFVLGPGEPIGMYHWEANQEDFLVLAGEGLLIVEGEERPLRQWDFVHCPVGAAHMIVGAGDGPCAVLAIGAREPQDGDAWGGYAVDEAALRHGAGVEEATTDAEQAYARFPEPVPTRYGDGWLPGSE